jgi:hypothetical protein
MDFFTIHFCLLLFNSNIWSKLFFQFLLIDLVGCNISQLQPHAAMQVSQPQ